MRASPQPNLSSSLFSDSEATTAVLRVTAGAAMVGLHLLGSLPDPHGLAGPGLALAALYAVATFVLTLRLAGPDQRYPRSFTWALTVLDNAIILGLSSITGGVGSPIVAILLLVITTTAARYGVRTAVACALIDSGVLVAIGAVAEATHGAGSWLHLALWWSWMLVGGAVIAGLIAKAAFGFRAELLEERHRGAVDRYERVLADSARRDLEQAAADRRDFLRVVAHELRTPIASIAALSKALGDPQPTLSASERSEALGLLDSHATHLQDLLTSVRDLAAGQPSEDHSLHLTEVDVVELVHASASAALVPPDRLAVDVAPAARVAHTDREKLRRILTNLLENAERHSRDLIAVTVDADADDIDFRIDDRGVGMSSDVAARVFEKGFSFGENRDSSGLGLWIVSELVGALGGEVHAEARNGGGIRMTVRIPRSSRRA